MKKGIALKVTTILFFLLFFALPVLAGVCVTSTSPDDVTFSYTTFIDTDGTDIFFQIDNTGDIICHECNFVSNGVAMTDCSKILAKTTGTGPGKLLLYNNKSTVFCSKDSRNIGRFILKIDRKVSQKEKEVIALEKNSITKIDSALTKRLAGQVLLQVENNGEAWFVDPKSGNKFYMQDGQTAYEILEAFGLGISSENLLKIPLGYDERLAEGLADSDGDTLSDSLEEAIGTNPLSSDTDSDGYDDAQEIKNGYRPDAMGKYEIDENFIGKPGNGILLQVEGDNANGQAWLLKDGKRYYIDPTTAYSAMRYLSLGISNDNLRKIQIGAFRDY